MATLASFITPINALIAGNGLAAFALERRGGTDFREIRWHEVEFTVIYLAVFVRYLQSGLPDREAKGRALAEVKGYLGSGTMFTVRALSTGSEQAVNEQPAERVKAKVRAYLVDNPDAVQLSVNQLLSTLNEQGVQVGRTTVAKVLREVKQAR